MQKIIRGTRIRRGDYIKIGRNINRKPYKIIIKIGSYVKHQDCVVLVGKIIYSDFGLDNIIYGVQDIGETMAFRSFYNGSGVDKLYKLTKNEYLIEVV